jgi:hypothetical protein
LATSKLINQGRYQMGDVSGISFHERPFYLKNKMLPDLAANSIEDFDQRLDAIIEQALGEDIRIIISQPLLVRCPQ